MFTATLVAIFTAPASGEPLVELPRIAATVGCGLAGDRYATDVARHARGYTKIRHVTLIEEEVASILLRNLVTRGVPLNHLIGRRFRIGDVELQGTELAEPWQYLADLIALPVLKPLLHRGGIRAEIMTGGVLHAGAEVTPLAG